MLIEKGLKMFRDYMFNQPYKTDIYQTAVPKNSAEESGKR